MLVFEPTIAGVGSVRSEILATTAAQKFKQSIVIPDELTSKGMSSFEVLSYDTSTK